MVYACVCACVCCVCTWYGACMCVYARVYVRMCVYARVCVCASVCCVCVCVHVCVCVMCMLDVRTFFLRTWHGVCMCVLCVPDMVYACVCMRVCVVYMCVCCVKIHSYFAPNVVRVCVCCVYVCMCVCVCVCVCMCVCVHLQVRYVWRHLPVALIKFFTISPDVLMRVLYTSPSVGYPSDVLMMVLCTVFFWWGIPSVVLMSIVVHTAHPNLNLSSGAHGVS